MENTTNPGIVFYYSFYTFSQIAKMYNSKDQHHIPFFMTLFQTLMLSTWGGETSDSSDTGNESTLNLIKYQSENIRLNKKRNALCSWFLLV